MEAKPKSPPMEVVLPTAYYLILVAESAGLAYWWATNEVAAGDRVGHTIGWAGTASMCLMHVYSLRKRVRALWSWGKLSTWLHVHIFLGLQGALLVCFHSAHLKTVANISGATIACTLVVVASGMFGRYLFALLPKNLTGERMTARDVESELHQLVVEIQKVREQHPSIEAALVEWDAIKPITGKMTFGELVAEDRRTRAMARHLERALEAGGEVGDFANAVRRRAQLARKLTMLTAAERSFRYWHILHKPLTFILLGVTVLHIVAHYIYAAQFHA